MLFPEIPVDFAALSDEEIEAFIAAAVESVETVAADPASFVNEEMTSAQLLAAMRPVVESVQAAREELAARDAAALEAETPPETPDEPDNPDEPETPETTAAEEAASLAAVTELAALAAEPETAVEPETVVAAAVPAPAPAPAPVPAPRPSRSRAARPQEEAVRMVSLTAGAGADHLPFGYEFPDELTIAEAMISRRKNFGMIPDGTTGEEVPIARADWSHLYPPERILGRDEVANEALVAAALNPRDIRAELDRRIKNPDSLTASGGLCAPVTPYYNLQFLSVADRPVRAALASFNADRGGIRYARPAALSAVTTGVGVRTVAQDAAGGTFATKTCQVVPCPPFTETDIEVIFHCIMFGNIGARTFPERVAQWNNLVLAAHARVAETEILTGIDTASTQVTAQSLGLGASGALLGQILAAANAQRSRHRMNQQTVLRLLMPAWATDLLVSDVIRGQFQRFDTDEERITAVLRSFDIEPTFYIDGATGAGQVFGAQNAGPLLPFPPTVKWYLFPEGSFLYLDGGVLELGLVRDSVLNATNDFQIFGESFENVAFVGIESLAVTSTVCDSGTVAAPRATVCPIDYSHST